MRVRVTESSVEFHDGAERLGLQLLGAKSKWQGESPTGEVISYHIGTDEKRWVNDVQKYARLRMKDALPGVDWVLYWAGDKLEYDFLVTTPDRVSSIQLQWDGLPVEFDASGRVSASFTRGTWLQQRPKFFAGGEELSGRIVASGQNRARFVSGAVTRIDPVIELAGTFGAEDDETVAIATTEYIIGTTYSSSWDVSGRSSGSDVFYREYSSGSQFRTLIWGGTGDEFLSPATHQGNKELRPPLIAGGWTTSRDLPRVPGVSTPAARYGGGESDGLIVGSSGGQFWAETIATPNSERVHSAIRNGPVDLYVAGEVLRPGQTQPDAFVRTPRGMWIAGGSGADRIRSIQIDGTSGLQVIFAAETDSDDLPGEFREGSVRGGARDVWYGVLDAFGAPRLVWQALYGGPANEDVAGMIQAPGRGVFIAGNTESNNLPLSHATQEAYGGGVSDGFVLKLSARGEKLQAATYWGGDGDDRILYVSMLAGDLLLSGSSDSTKLPFPGIGDARGATDAILTVLDANLKAYWSYRAGGAGDDAFTFAYQAENQGALVAGGTSTQPGWVGELGAMLTLPNPAPGGKRDAFVLSLRRQLISGAKQILGLNLQMPVALQSMVEYSKISTLHVRSADPEIVQVGPAVTARSTPQDSIYIYGFGHVAQPQMPANVAFQIYSMGRVGATEVIVSGPDLPEFRVPVEVVPSLIFVSNPEQRVATTIPFNVRLGVEFAPRDPETGVRLAAQLPRPGFAPRITYESSDPDALQLLILRQISDRYESEGEILKAGTFKIIPRSEDMPTAAEAVIDVMVILPRPSTVVTRSYLAPSGVIWRHAVSSDGGQTRVTVEDPTMLKVGLANFGESGAELNFTPLGFNPVFYVQTLGHSGRTRLRIEPQVGPVTVVEVLIYRASAYVTGPATAVRNASVRLTVQLITKRAEDFADAQGFRHVDLAPAPLMAERWIEATCDDKSISLTHLLAVNVVVGPAGFAKCVVTLPAAHFDEFRLVWDLEVLEQTVRASDREILVPEGGNGSVLLFPQLPPEMLPGQAVQLTRANVVGIGNPPAQQGTISLQNQANVYVRALGKVGDTTSLQFTNPALNNLQIPIRIVPAALTTPRPVMRVGTSSGGAITVSLTGRDGDRLLDQVWSPNTRSVLKATSSDPAVCTVPSTVSLEYSQVGVPITCSGSGETIVTVEVESGLVNVAPVQVRLIRQSNPLLSQPRVPPMLISPNFQSPYSWSSWGGDISSVFRVENPELIRLSQDPGRTGGDRLQLDLSNFTRDIYLQGLALGSTRIWVERSGADPVSYPVEVVPASLVFQGRQHTTDPDGRSVLPLSDRAGTNAYTSLLALPVDPFSGDVDIPASPTTPALVMRLMAEATPRLAQVNSSNPDVVAVRAPTPILGGNTFDLPLALEVLKSGVTNLEAVQPEGMNMTPRSTLKVVVPKLAFELTRTAYVSPGFQAQMTLSAANRDTLPPGSRVTSLDPGRLVLSQNADVIGSATLQLGNRPTFYVQAIGQTIDVRELRIRVEADGVEPQEFPVYLEPMAVRYGDGPDERRVLANDSGQAVFALYFGLRRSFTTEYSGALSFLPGRQPEITVRTSDPTVVSVRPGSASYTGPQATSFRFLLTVGLPGESTMEVDLPEVYQMEARKRTIVVPKYTFSLRSGSSTVGTGLVQRFELHTGTVTNVPITVAIASGFGFTIGQSDLTATASSITLPARAGNLHTFYLCACGSVSSSTLRISANLFEDLFVPVNPIPTQWTLVTGLLPDPIALSRGSVTAVLTLPSPLGPVTPPLTIRLSSSVPGVARFESGSAVWQPGESTLSIPLRLIGAGSTLLTFETDNHKISYTINVR